MRDDVVDVGGDEGIGPKEVAEDGVPVSELGKKIRQRRPSSEQCCKCRRTITKALESFIFFAVGTV